MIRDLCYIIKTIIYTLWEARGFKYFGNKSQIRPTLDLIVGRNFIEIGDNTVLGKHIQLTAWGKHQNLSFTPYVKIGSNCQIGSYNHITAINSIIIGNGVLTGKFVTITDNSHGIPGEEADISPINRIASSKGSVVIEDNVWIGDKATILPNVRIGKGSIIGANAVVTKDVPSYCVVGGNPAKIIKQLK